MDVSEGVAITVSTEDINRMAEKMYSQLPEYEREELSLAEYQYALRYWFEEMIDGFKTDLDWWLGRNYTAFQRGLREASQKLERGELVS